MHARSLRIVLPLLLLVPLFALAAVPSGDPAFDDPLSIDNPWHPFVPYRLRVYEVKQGHTDLTVLDVFRADTRTFTLDGDTVACRCLEEWEIEDGEVVEISRNWFAQADDGTVYYFGETVDLYEDGVVVGHDGSWLVGGPGPGDPAGTATAAAPAVFMPADPEVGDRWKPEDLPAAGIEEFVEVVRYRRRGFTPYALFRDVLEVREETPDIELKWYAAGVGFVRAKDGNETLHLTDLIDAGGEAAMLDELDAILEDLLGDDEDA